MVGHVAYPEIWGDQPASLVPGVYELLRDQGFDGRRHHRRARHGRRARPLRVRPAPAMAIGAGADAVLVNQGDQIDVLHQAWSTPCATGGSTRRRLDEAAGRMLAPARPAARRHRLPHRLSRS